MTIVRLFGNLLKDTTLGPRIVPIVADEARTFGMANLFRQIGIYSPFGQAYEPEDAGSMLYCREAADGQLLEEGITEAGAISSWTAAATSYSVHGVAMLPIYIFYSMFGFQRVGDLAWAAADMRCRGFLMGGTAGRTTLNGEGLQHQDGHTHIVGSTIPNLLCYDPAYAYEIAIIVQDGIRRMYENGESIFYYLTIGNENYKMEAMPEGCKEGIVKGMYKFRPTALKQSKAKSKIHLLGSGPILRSALKAQELLADKYGIAADVWSVTSYKELRRDALECERWNRLHPTATPKRSYLENLLANEKGVFIAVSDYMKIWAESIARWVPGGLTPMGTDGFGRSESRPALRRFFEIDGECVTIAALEQLARRGELKLTDVDKAIKDLGIDPDKADPVRA
jgi:pyruvate dehydrogenase E1 component